MVVSCQLPERLENELPKQVMEMLKQSLVFSYLNFLLFDWKGFCLTKTSAHKGDFKGARNVVGGREMRWDLGLIGHCLDLTPGMANKPLGSHFLHSPSFSPRKSPL